jgi:hypothetical protein
MVRVPVITLDTLLEFVKRQVIDELEKHSLPGIHPSFSAIRDDPIENSNRKYKLNVIHFIMCAL